MSAANPDVSQIPVRVHGAELHSTGPTRVIPFDLSKDLGLDYSATSPNLMASFLRICIDESLETSASATSQAFYIIRGSGKSVSQEFGTTEWSKGDLFVYPATKSGTMHFATSDTAIYWVTDEPLLEYLGVEPKTKKFNPTLFKKERMLSEVEAIKHAPGTEHKNRLGILLGNKSTESTTKTLTHTLWSLLNILPPKDAQRPHRHNSVALDLCVSSAPTSSKGVYTLMGPELGPDGWVKNPVRCDWVTGAVFTTPPGWWHSHHNETDEPAWVLPMQDAGLYTYQRTLDIRFAPPIIRSVSRSDLAH
jgi:gentisate 1,2-dioxygenase